MTSLTVIRTIIILGIGITTLDDKAGDNPVECSTVEISIFRKQFETFYVLRSRFRIKFYRHFT